MRQAPPPLIVEVVSGREPPDAAIVAWARLLLSLVEAETAEREDAA